MRITVLSGSIKPNTIKPKQFYKNSGNPVQKDERAKPAGNLTVIFSLSLSSISHPNYASVLSP
jgi:hypothetical protein